MDVCNNTILRQFYPNLTCKSTAESIAMLPYVELFFAHIEQYLDISDFKDPIKYNLMSYAYKLNNEEKTIYLEVGS